MKPFQRHIIVNGFPQSGKDTFVYMCMKEICNHELLTKSVSSVDPIKKAAMMLGWGGEKDDKGRQFLSDLKDLSTDTYDYPMMYMMSQIAEWCNASYITFFHIREPKEIEKFVNSVPKTITCCIHRPESEKHHTNTGDKDVLNYPYDVQIRNEGTLEDLEQAAKLFVRQILSVGGK